MTTTTRTEAPEEVAETSADTSSEPPVWRGMVSGVVSAVLIALLLLVMISTVLPRLIGGAGLTVLSSSMEPTYSPGDMVITVPQESYAIGDVVTFQPVSNDPTLVTHRIVAQRSGADGVSYVTRGDANGSDDEPIVADQVMGKVLYHVPYIGHVSLAIGDHRNTLILVVAAGLLLYASYALGSAVIGGIRGKRRRHE
ncbi:signal peptidase I [Yaniella halotolerans]|uniref:signal peptidase I n=1 Tax=Yaniella halotolerans TaxID=225453 RepID=UPI0003B7B5BA|nr:signal peptidase I [Yaniella halotolerans]